MQAFFMYKDVRYVTGSHGWRCDHVQMYGMSQGAMDGGVTMYRCTVCHKEPWMAV